MIRLGVVLTVVSLCVGAGALGFGLAQIDIGSCSHELVSCRDVGARFIPPSL